MLSHDIRARIHDAVQRDGRSMRAISLAAGLNQHFVAQLLSTGREPGVGQFLALCEELGVTVGSIIFGVDVTPKQEELARKILSLSDDSVRLIEEMVQKLAPPERQ